MTDPPEKRAGGRAGGTSRGVREGRRLPGKTYDRSNRDLWFGSTVRRSNHEAGLRSPSTLGLEG
eukprot:4024894-Alexandrium_andersonii.AAC.1